MAIWGFETLSAFRFSWRHVNMTGILFDDDFFFVNARKMTFLMNVKKQQTIKQTII